MHEVCENIGLRNLRNRNKFLCEKVLCYMPNQVQTCVSQIRDYKRNVRKSGMLEIFGNNERGVCPEGKCD